MHVFSNALPLILIDFVESVCAYACVPVCVEAVLYCSVHTELSDRVMDTECDDIEFRDRLQFSVFHSFIGVVLRRT